MDSIRKQIIRLCVDIGKDRLLVQGAGGNISWKEDEILWVKGSGAWLSSADQDDFFVPIDLPSLKSSLAIEEFDIKPRVVGRHAYRPSIETVLHALLPNKIVVHLHAVEILSYLVTLEGCNSVESIAPKLSLDPARCAFVDYHKPGPELAKAVHNALRGKPNCNIIFLKNHGVVIGANSVDEVWKLLGSISNISESKNACINYASLSASPSPGVDPVGGYSPLPDLEVQNLAFDPSLYKRLYSDWALYPDHVVFLGGSAFTFSSWAEFVSKKTPLMDPPALIFIENAGVFVSSEFNVSQAAQLRCYFDVISRIDPNTALDPLCQEAVNELLNWDAEKHRISLTR